MSATAENTWPRSQIRSFLAGALDAMSGVDAYPLSCGKLIAFGGHVRNFHARYVAPPLPIADRRKAWRDAHRRPRFPLGGLGCTRGAAYTAVGDALELVSERGLLAVLRAPLARLSLSVTPWFAAQSAARTRKLVADRDLGSAGGPLIRASFSLSRWGQVVACPIVSGVTLTECWCSRGPRTTSRTSWRSRSSRSPAT